MRDIAAGHPLPAVAFKGVSREVVPYVIDGLLGVRANDKHVLSERSDGLDFYLDLNRVDDLEAERLRGVLGEALTALERRAADVMRQSS